MKKLLILVIAFIMCLTLVGCDEEEVDTTIDKSTQESEEVGDESYFYEDF